SVGTSNEGLNTMVNLGVFITARTVDRRKKMMSDTHGKYVKNFFEKYSENALILNVDDYHNIH
ncbi:1860_t:CDS:1, partial [Funneliformis geosporum]